MYFLVSAGSPKSTKVKQQFKKEATSEDTAIVTLMGIVAELTIKIVNASVNAGLINVHQARILERESVTSEINAGRKKEHAESVKNLAVDVITSSILNVLTNFQLSKK